MPARPVTTLCAAASVALLTSTSAAAQVLESAANGFAVRSVVTVAAPPARVYEALVNVARWWDPAHTYSGDASGLSIEARAGGCFCERLDEQGSVQHGTVVYAAPGRTLRLSAALGPLQESGVTGALTFELADKDGGTVVTLTYVAGGYRQGGLQALAAPVLSVLSTQLQRFQRFVDRGSAVP